MMKNVFWGGLFVCYFCIVAAPAFSQETAIGPVHINATHIGGNEFGGGYTIARDGRCFVITAYHVVAKNKISANSISVTDITGRQARARIIDEEVNLDLALLEVETGSKLNCSQKWHNGQGLIKKVSSAQYIVAERITESGESKRTRMMLARTDPGASELEFEPYNHNEVFRSGDSGFPVFADGDLFGIILSTKSNQTAISVLRQDIIHGHFSSRILKSAPKNVAVAEFLDTRDRFYELGSIWALDHLNSYGKYIVHEHPGINWRKNNSYGRSSTPRPAAPPGTEYELSGKIISFDRSYGTAKTQQVKNSDNPLLGIITDSIVISTNNKKCTLTEYSNGTCTGSRRTAKTYHYEIGVLLRLKNLKSNKTDQKLYNFSIEETDSGNSEMKRRIASEQAIDQAISKFIDDIGF